MGNKLELLAPAGSLETCKAVIQAGADAVYLGGQCFGARAYAANFTDEELLEALDFAHLRGRKIYLTVNTLLKQREIAKDLYPYLLAFYEHGLDAVIVQDYGVMELVHEYFPDLPIHVSTQMSVADACGAAYLKERGACRIVPARELSLEEIRLIHKSTGVELECFIHGALCYCYSGQCLFSSMLGGRSGNRGRCAQPCRLPYTVLDENHRQISKSRCYPLSPKDLCTVDLIPELADAGVYSFKIEGRMKTTAYAAGVVEVYRRVIDAYLSGRDAAATPEDKKRLLDTGSRCGFTDGYYHRHNGRGMISMKQSSHTKNSDAVMRQQPVHEDFHENFHENFHQKNASLEQKLPLDAMASFHAGKPARLTVSYKDATGCSTTGLVETAKKQPMSRDILKKQLAKLGNTPFFLQNIQIDTDDSIFIQNQSLNELRRLAVADLTENILGAYKRTAPVNREDALAAIASLRATAGAAQENADTVFAASIEDAAQLDAVAECGFLSRVCLDSSLYTRKDLTGLLRQHVRRLHDGKKQAYFILPAVIRPDTARFYAQVWTDIMASGIDGFYARSQDGLGFLDRQVAQADKKHCILDHSLYTYSDYTKACYAADGWLYDTAPLECNRRELSERDNTSSELILYGYVPLMVSAQCVHANTARCDRTKTLCYLKDRYNKEFAVKNVCSECYNTIYNSQPLSLLQHAGELKELGFSSYRLQFTLEQPDQVRKILDYCGSVFFHSGTAPAERGQNDAIISFTNGHYKRGVE